MAYDGQRREFLKGAGAAIGAAFAAPFISSRPARADGKVVVASGSGTFQQGQIAAFFKPFMEETGIEVEVLSEMSLAQVRAMVESGNIMVDVIGRDAGNTIVMGDYGWLEPLDYDHFRREDLDRIDAGNRTTFGLAYSLWAEVMAYRTDLYPTGSHPKNWVEFWDTDRFPGGRCLGDPGYGQGFEFALLGDGVPVSKLYPLDIDRGMDSMHRIKDHVVAWWGQTVVLPVQLLTDREIALASLVPNRAVEAIEAGAPIGIEWNEGKLHQSMYSVPKGASNKQGAMRLIAYAARAEPQAKFATLASVGPVNPAAYDFIDPKFAETLPTHPSHRDKMFLRDNAWWAATNESGKTNLETVIERWEMEKLR